MKKSGITAMVCLAIITLISCGNNNQAKNSTMETTEDRNENIFPKGEKASNDYFTGTVFVEPLLNSEDMEGLYTVGQVTFEPGARTNWHTHPIGQVLLVLDGNGFYQERGKSARELTKGSVVAIPKDVEHWHGAAADSRFVHIAISNMADGNNVTWMTPVNNEEYSRVNP